MISAAITADANTFIASVQAAMPLEQATELTLAALVTAGNQLLADIQTARAALSPTLDAADPTGFPGDMVAALNMISIDANDQTALSDMQGLIGRVVFNLAQV